MKCLEHFENGLYRVLHERSNIFFSLTEHVNLQKINYFCTCSLRSSRQIKIKSLVSGHWTFRNCYIEGAPGKIQQHWCFRVAPGISKKVTFAHCLWVNSCQTKLKKDRIRTAYILKLLHTGCSTNKEVALLLSQNT